MGCIVNGPGEMADADFGYVGSGPGKVNLYVGKECVERHVPAAEADRAPRRADPESRPLGRPAGDSLGRATQDSQNGAFAGARPFA